MKKVEFKVGKNSVSCVGFIHDDLSSVCESYVLRPYLVICPGGGYVHLSPREAEPASMKFYAHGINTFILYYSIGDAIGEEKPWQELEAAMKHINDNASAFNCLASASAVMGFSAGAHVAASYTVFSSFAPSLCVLGYPVITSGVYGHQGSFDALCSSSSEREFYSLEKRVSGKVCPVFIFHTANDEAVPVENSLLFASALSAVGSPFALHIYQEGKHGFSVATREVGSCYPALQGWCDECLDWMFSNWGWIE